MHCIAAKRAAKFRLRERESMYISISLTFRLDQRDDAVRNALQYAESRHTGKIYM